MRQIEKRITGSEGANQYQPLVEVVGRAGKAEANQNQPLIDCLTLSSAAPPALFQSRALELWLAASTSVARVTLTVRCGKNCRRARARSAAARALAPYGGEADEGEVDD
ncbi:Ubiquitin [Psidium guajava]|nr:Ubiquitin [Psidium guajava]